MNKVISFKCIYLNDIKWYTLPVFQTNVIGVEFLIVSPKFRNVRGETVSQTENQKPGEEIAKRTRISPAKEEHESVTSGDDFFTLLPCFVTLGSGVRITSVAAGGRHTLALSGK